VSLREIGVPVLDLIDHQLVVQKLIEQSVQAITVDNAHAIVLGCTGFVNVREEVQAGLLEAGYDTVVIEAAQAAMVMLENFVTMGYMQSRLNYMPPRQKDRNWWMT
jgi:allantoin racemase